MGFVSTALGNATLDKNSTKQVLIQSADTAVLAKFQDNPSYKKVYLIEEKIGDAPKQTVTEIKKYAQVVNLPKTSIIRVSQFFTTDMTNIVKEMKDANLTVFVHLLKNEYTALPFDYIADPLTEIATFTQVAKVDGIITEFPATASRYMCKSFTPFHYIALGQKLVQMLNVSYQVINKENITRGESDNLLFTAQKSSSI